MATVYLARDLKHNRPVAVKVLQPELVASLGVDRFLREIQIVAQLNHPHVLPLLDSGEAAGLLYYSMPFVSGGSLRARLNREAPLDLPTVLTLIREVADALSYAHRQGVLHRDIKPENILFSEGHAVVADFGIAKAISTAGGDELTRTGFPLGTVGYMSPEQAAGSTRLGESTDVFSLAVVCYEMLVGETPGLWPTDEAVRLGRFLDAPMAHRELLDRLPGRIEQALTAAMAMSPQSRLRTPAELIARLTDSSGGQQRYPEPRVRSILQRAAEMELEHPTDEGALSLGSVQQIGAQVDLAPDRVRSAAAELEAETRNPAKSGIFGVSAQIDLERSTEGEIRESEYESVLEEIRGALGEVGRINPTLGKSLSWNSLSFQNTLEGSGRLIHVMVSPRDGKTKMRVTEGGGTHTALFVGGTIAGGILGSILGGAIGLEGIQTLPAGVVALSGSYFAFRTIFRALISRRRRVLDALLDRLSLHAARPSARHGDEP
jgi:serine/threonine protein kinase